MSQAEFLCCVCMDTQKRECATTLDCCAHQFCLTCIQTWAKINTACPLCKQRFTEITHKGHSVPIVAINPSEEAVTRCIGCSGDHDEHVMLLCDECDAPWHIYCLTPAIYSVPEGDWYCAQCQRRRRLVRTRDFAPESPVALPPTQPEFTSPVFGFRRMLRGRMEGLTPDDSPLIVRPFRRPRIYESESPSPVRDIHYQPTPEFSSEEELPRVSRVRNNRHMSYYDDACEAPSPSSLFERLSQSRISTFPSSTEYGSNQVNEESLEHTSPEQTTLTGPLFPGLVSEPNGGSSVDLDLSRYTYNFTRDSRMSTRPIPFEQRKRDKYKLQFS